MIELARVRAPSNVDCLLTDVMVTDLPVGHYDAIVSMSTLHHLALESALLRLAQALRPGGVLAVVACRAETFLASYRSSWRRPRGTI